ncbi:hypothetical protein D3C81_2280230 [compost metagenome]
MPDFPQYVSLRISTFNHLAEFPPEIMIHFIGNVQTPAIDPDFFDPVFCDFQ